jgi:hypothetical protein
VVSFWFILGVFLGKTGGLMPQTGQNPLAGVTSWLMGAFSKLFIMNKMQGDTDGTLAPGRGEGGGVIN